MSALERRSITELIARFELEPELDDVFVEGRFDREVLECCLQGGQARRAIYEIDSVDIPASTLTRHGLTDGNKQRVIALARELQVISNPNYLCLVDKDLDHWFGRLETTPGLRWSAYCSIELHFLTREILRDVLLTVGQAKIGDLDHSMASICLTLRELFILRLVDRERSLALRWVALRKYISRQNDRITFERDSYITALLTSNSCVGRRGDFDSSYSVWVSKLSGDYREHARGHDFVELLAWAVKEFRGQKEFATVSAINRLLILLARHVPSIASELN